MSTVSVIIPTYNCAHWVTQAIDSVLAQTTRVEEILVIDDGSQDDTRNRLGAYGDLVHYQFQENQGVSAARNRISSRMTWACAAGFGEAGGWDGDGRE